VAVPFATIEQLHALYRRREASPVEVTRLALERIEHLNPVLNAFITVTGAAALAAAREAESRILAGEELRPLEGIPLSVKDIFQTRGVRTTCASPVLADWEPDEDAVVVERLKAAGAVLLGKNNMLEFAYAAAHPAFGDCRNPWDGERRTGGSSSGSAAAVAAGIGCGSLGTDTGGSIRIPAAYCGLVGVKPTYGLVSTEGVIPLSRTLDHVGPLTRTVGDADRILSVIAGTPAAALQGGVRGLRFGVDSAMVEGAADPEAASLVRKAIEALAAAGAEVVEVHLPPAAEVVPVLNAILAPEASAYHRNWLRERPQDYSPAVREKLEKGAQVPAVEYVEARQAAGRLLSRCQQVLDRVDLILTGTTPTAAPLLNAARTLASHDALVSRTGIWNLTGLPAVTVPCGFTEGGLPVGLQIIGRPLSEALILQAAAAVEAARPPISWCLEEVSRG
jgi:aspartyl-tRNA(Asn)/glutamyl-tRNA(Gln) amidotransferase subunit A